MKVFFSYIIKTLTSVFNFAIAERNMLNLKNCGKIFVSYF